VKAISLVALSAPGAGIYSTVKGGTYGGWNGTSFSSPVAAGVAALMMAAKPSLDGTKIESLMYSTAFDLGAAGRDPLYGYGRVDATAGVQAAANTVVAADTQPPTSSITSPSNKSSVSGTVAVNVNAADNVGVVRVELSVNGTVVAVDNASPYGFSWDSTGVPNGSASLIATAYDAAGNATASTPVTVTVANNIPPVGNDTTPPTVSITNPTAGAVTGTVSVNVSASDDSGAAGISTTLYIDGALKAKGTGSTLSYSWNTKKVKAGPHTIQATAKDAAGNSSTSSVQVTTN
jgi:hypothetical protein